MTYDEREQRTRDYYAAVHTDRLLNSATAVMRVADREQAELRARLARVRSVCMNTDGDYLDGDTEIPVGEVLRMLFEDQGGLPCPICGVGEYGDCQICAPLDVTS